MNAKTSPSIYQLRVTLKDSQPPIWRSIQLLSTATLEELHNVIQLVMGWADAHPHEFNKGQERYGVFDEDFPEVNDEVEYQLDQVLAKEQETLVYEYDFGDGWEHEIVLEKVLPYAADTVLPICLKGERASPPEDVGGVPGYQLFLEAINDPSHPDHKNNIEWIGEDFDPEQFDLAETNELLREYCD